MAPKRTQQEEAVAAGERNVVPGQAWIEALIRGIGREMVENSMGGAPFGQATREELGSLGYEQMLREQYPEEFARGRLYGSEAFPTDVASLYAARPGRSAFTQIAGREAGAAGGPRAIGGAGAPALNYEPVAAAPRGSFDANMMEAYRRGAAGSRAPGRPQAFRPEDFLAIEQGPLPTSRNAFEANAVMAQRRGMPSPAPAAYDYEGPAGPGPFIDRPRSRFDENAMAAYYRNQGKGEYGPYVPGRRTGPGAVELDYTPEEMGQGVALRQGSMPMAQQGGVPAVRGGLPTFARGEYQAPYGAYGEFRDVTGNVLRGPAGSDRLGYSPIARELPPEMAGGAPEVGGEYRPGYGGADRSMLSRAVGAAIPGAGMGTLGMMPILSEDQQRRNRFTLPPMHIGRNYGPPIPYERNYGPPMPEERNYGPPMSEEAPVAPGRSARPVLPRQDVKSKGKRKATGEPMQLPGAQGDQFEPNLNYYVTQAIDRLMGQDEANRGKDYQQYYATNPWPY